MTLNNGLDMNGTMMQFFEWYCEADGRLWKKFESESARLAGMGITAVWLPPAYKGMNGGSSQGYDVYDIYDLGEFDQKGSVRTKYGTRDEYVAAIETAKKNGLGIYPDIVLNHMGGADETEKIRVRKVNPENRNEYISDQFEIEAYTKFTFPNRKGKYSGFQWDHTCFTGVDSSANTENAIFKIMNGHDEWEETITDEKGNYDFLMLADIEFRNNAVTEELKRWIKWYYDTIHFDGLRLDAVKHIPVYFYNDWLDYVRKEIKNDLFVVGEYWIKDVSALVDYINATEGRMSLFDAPLQGNFHVASGEGNKYDLRKIFDNTLVAAKPDLAVTLVSNHDTQPCQALEAALEDWFKPLAYALILLRQDGYPCIFYADLYGSEYTDLGKDGNGCHVVLNKVEELESLIGLRRDHAYGLQRDYFDHANCIGWTREGGEDAEQGCAVLMSNGDAGTKTMEMGKKHAGKTFIDHLHKHDAEVKVDEDRKSVV